MLGYMILIYLMTNYLCFMLVLLNPVPAEIILMRQTPFRYVCYCLMILTFGSILFLFAYTAHIIRTIQGKAPEIT